MKSEDILALLPSGDKPAVTFADGVVSITYTAEQHAARVSIDDIALRERFNVVSSEQEDDAQRGGDGRLVHLRGFIVRYVLGPKPPSQKTTTRNG